MLLKSLTLENFKGIRDPVTIDFKPVTLLFGPNSAGKSTVVQALHYLREILERNNVDPDRTRTGGAAIDLGGFQTLVYNHELDRSVRIRVDLNLEREDLPEYFGASVSNESTAYDLESTLGQISHSAAKAWVQLEISWSEATEKPFVQMYETGINGKLFARITASADGRQIGLSYLNIRHPVFKISLGQTDLFSEDEPTWFESLVIDCIKTDYHNDESIASIGLAQQTSVLPQWGQRIELDDGIWNEDGVDTQKENLVDRNVLLSTITMLTVGPGQRLKEQLSHFIYLGPLREVPERNYEPVRSLDESRWAHGLAAWDVLYNAGTAFLESINDWLSGEQRLNTGYRVDVKHYKELEAEGPLMLALTQGRALDEDDFLIQELINQTSKSRLYLQDEKNGIEVLPKDVGVGISQLLPVIVAALHARSGIVAVEQPELHIHPAWQVELGDLFLSQIQDKDVLFLVETHSEHLVLRIMRRMRETFQNSLPPGTPSASPNNVSVFYVEVYEGRTIIRDMPLNETGELVKAWPGGFFEERMPELF